MKNKVRYRRLSDITKRIDKYHSKLYSSYTEINFLEMQLNDHVLMGTKELWEVKDLKERRDKLDRRIVRIRQKLDRLKEKSAEFQTMLLPILDDRSVAA